MGYNTDLVLYTRGCDAAQALGCIVEVVIQPPAVNLVISVPLHRSNYDGKRAKLKQDNSIDGHILGNSTEDMIALSDSDEEDPNEASKHFGDMTVWTRPVGNVQCTKAMPIPR
jgi:hypothetical protein